jgi:hypothetical protein
MSILLNIVSYMDKVYIYKIVNIFKFTQSL